jgi:Flp pilus assembly protein TadG
MSPETTMTRIERLRRDESGMTYVFMGLSMMAFISASMLAIDVGMLMTARNQAQNSADAGALAGVTALVHDDWDDRSPTGPAVTNAIAAATANAVMARGVSVRPEDVEFLNDPAGEPNRVKVTVFRQASRGNPLSTLIAQYFGVATADIAATATAEAADANAMTCVKPFTIPDKWREVQTPPWDGSDTYDAFNNRGEPLANPDVYIPANQPGYTGYNQESERGQRLEIRAATGNNITVSFYFSLALGKPPITGGAEYDWNIANCNTTIYHWGDPLTTEPGAMAGPTIQGAEALIARDPNAFWNTATNRMEGSAFGHSPRVFPIPLYDPPYYDEGKRNGRNADLITANWIGFFLEEIQGNGLWGRIIPITGIRDRNSPAPPEGLNPKAIRLVQ